MKDISIYPHYGFINTNFIIHSKNRHIKTYLKVMPEERILHMPPTDGYISVKFQPGEHQLLLLDSSDKILQSENIYVDDAIKIGGSTFSGKFVLPDWIILVMKDRSYFYNRFSKEERMEFKIHPNNIRQITSNILLFEENNYYNFFSMDTMTSIATFHRFDYIFHDNNTIVHKSRNNEIVIITDFTHKLFITYDEYIFHEEGKTLYLYNKTENHIQFINISNTANPIYIPIATDISFLGFTNEHYVVLKDDKNNYYTTNLETTTKLYTFPIDKVRDYFQDKNSIHLRVNNKDIRINDNLTITIINDDLYIVAESKKKIKQVSPYMTYEYSDIKKYIINDLNDIKPISLINNKIYFQDKKHIVFSEHSSENTDLEIYNIKNKEISIYQNIKAFIFNNECIYAKYNNSKGEINEIYNLDGELLIKGNKIGIDYRFSNTGVINVDNSYNYYYHEGKFKETFRQGYISCNNIISAQSGYYYFSHGELRALPYKLNWFTGDSDCLLYEENNQWNLLEWDNKMDRYTHSIIFSNIDRNYYKNAMFCENGSQILCQQKDNTFCFYNILTGEITPYHLDTSVQRNFNANQLLVSNNENKRIIFKDPISLKPITTEWLSSYRFASLDGRYNIDFKNFKEEIEILQNGEKKKKKYFEIKENVENKIIKIYTTNPIKYINYASFSYDSKIVAFVGATPSTGFVIIYDLESKQTLFEYPSKEKLGFNSGAIWISSFNKDGKLAIYNSSPTTYIFNPDKDYKSFKPISQRNFLCYSPTGNYMALSTQGYNAWAYGTNSFWGHQKSTKVFIRKTNDSNMELGPLEIFGNVEIPRTNQNNVGSVAFSLDESKILVVLNDGTLVVKNIQLKDNSLWEIKE